MAPFFRRFLLSATLASLGACSTTTFVSTWKAPDAQQVTPVGNTVAAIFVTRNEVKRRIAEDALAADLTRRGANGIAGYTVLPDDARSNEETTRRRLMDAGCTGAVVLRVVGRDQTVTYTPTYVATMPAYYNQFGPYWSFGWRTVYEPGYLQTDTVVSVETMVYSLNQGRLIWAGTSHTSNPKNVDSLVKQVADAAAQVMRKQGILAP